MKKTICFLLAGGLFLAGCGQDHTEPATTVHLKGQLTDMGTVDVPMRYDGASSLLGNSRDILLHTDSAGYFDTIVTIKEPAYYSICRNTLYLTPGDDLTLKITQSNQEAEFQGIGAEANNYMKYRLFPKGGSFLEAGENLRSSFDATKVLIDSLAAERQKQLDGLTNVSATFKELETARIRADVANSYICYGSYARVEDRAAFTAQIAPYVQPLLAGLNNDAYLDVAVVRDVLSYAFSPMKDQWASGIEFSPHISELYRSAEWIEKLNSQVTKQLTDSVTAYAATLNDSAFKAEVIAKVEQSGKLLPGHPAFDIELEDTEGNTIHLSDLKGNVLYVDLWATWCGPCKQESPYFEKLAKAYAGKAVTFVPVSTDTNKKAWLSYLAHEKKALKQYNSVDTSLRTHWEIHYIPRFLVIDKNFNIVDAYAPRPSEKEKITALLDRLLAE